MAFGAKKQFSLNLVSYELVYALENGKMKDFLLAIFTKLSQRPKAKIFGYCFNFKNS